MAINRGALLAQTYQLPAPTQQAPVPQNPFVDEVGQPASGLQQIDGVTSEYFQKWAALKGFARDVQENLGVDVRFPDPSIPESERLHRVYLKAMADLKAQGERLKTGQQMYAADRQRGALMTKDPSTMYYDQMDVGNDIIDKELDPIVLQANEKLKGPYYYGDKSIKEALAYYDQVKAMLENRKKTDTGNAGYWQKQIDALVRPTQSEKVWDPTKGGYTKLQSAQIRAAGGYLKEVANVLNGSADGYKVSSTEVGEDGDPVYEYNGFNKQAYGGGIIKGVFHEPNTGKTYAKLSIKGQGGQTSTTNAELSRADIMGFAKELAGSNPKYAAQGAYLDVYALETELYGPDNSVAADSPGLRRDDYEDVIKSRTKELEGLEQKSRDNAIKSMEEELQSLKYRGPFTDDDRKTYKTEDGKTITVVARKSKTATADGTYPVVYEVENIKELVPGKDSDYYNKYKKLQSWESVRNLLLNMRVKLDAGTKTAPTSKNRADIL